jgi:hypothetical protein
MDIGIGETRRCGNQLVLRSAAGSSMEVEISVSAGEVLRTIGTILATPSSLAFVVGLPYFWLRGRFGHGAGAGTDPALRQSVDINKPW